jgi:hypothetical protein
VNPEAQRIAIAEACGWTECVFIEALCDCRGLPPEGYKGDTVYHDSPDCWLPDYLNDLNAMADARKSLTSDQQEEFIYQLSLICCPITGETWEMVDSSAGQQAETLLKTLGLWVEEDAQ